MIDKTVHTALRLFEHVRWHGTGTPGVSFHFAQNRVYVFKIGEGKDASFVLARGTDYQEAMTAAGITGKETK